MEEKITYRSLLRQSNYRKSLISGMIGRFVDSVDAIAFTWIVYAVTGSASWSAFIYALNKIPTVLLQPFAGVWVEGLPKKTVCVVTDIIRAAVVAVMGLLFLWDMVTVFVLAIFTLLISGVEAFNLPAGSAMIPKYLEKEYYEHGMSLKMSLSNVFELAGMAAAGVIIGTGGVGLAFLIDGAGFLLSALIYMTIKTAPEKLEKSATDVRGFLAKIWDGMRYIKTKTVIFNSVLLGVVVNALLTPLNAFQSVMAIEIFGMGSEFLSFFGIFLISGMSLGSLLLPALMKDGRSRMLVVLFGVLLSIGYVSLTFGRFVYGMRILCYVMISLESLILGISISVINGVVSIQFMKHIDESYLSRVSATQNALTVAAIPVISLVCSGAASLISIVALFLACGILTMLLFLAVGIFRLKLE